MFQIFVQRIREDFQSIHRPREPNQLERVTQRLLRFVLRQQEDKIEKDYFSCGPRRVILKQDIEILIQMSEPEIMCVED